ncbi:EAL domain-containing protein [Alcaligenes phenolicus]|uniref:EAL domain-containing protein n=1 Tax=Alcaligenes phenolicus TaxID=232846 RepID=A0AAW5W416_9BURK|nr:EAL domain-containing protein [Alcaligenes phenolicus]MCX5567054.1 EAL domain-containing protein [Alcaligenes phenolicus]
MFAPSVFQQSSGCLTYRPSRTLAWSTRRARSESGLWVPRPAVALPGAQAGGAIISRSVLLDALHKDQIQAWLQPKVTVRSQKLVALEALARWRHPQLGLLSPHVFLPWFSEHGLDEALLMHVLQEVLGLQAYWRRQGTVMPVSVNLPTHLLDDAGLPDRLMACVQAKRGRACDITFELLENSDTKTACALFMGACRLVAMGFGLAQDDVGVDYSSMERLAGAPFSELKLDRRFVHGLSADRQQAAQVLGWIATAKERGLRVTAEGVEAQADLDILQQMGCDYAQGYLFAKPTPAFELDMWMRQRWPA